MNILKRLDQLLVRLEGAIAVVLLLVMLLLGFTQVILRNVFSGGLVWGDALLRHLVLWLGFLGAMLAASQERHINIDAVTRFLPSRVQSALHVVTNLFAATICTLLLQAGVTFLDMEIESGHAVYQGVPAVYAEIIIPVGFGLLAVHFLIRAVTRAHEALKGRAA